MAAMAMFNTMFGDTTAKDAAKALNTKRDAELAAQDRQHGNKIAPTMCKCDNCGHVCRIDELKEVKHLAERLDYPEGDPRCIMPDGECPHCGCLSYAIEAQAA